LPDATLKIGADALPNSVRYVKNGPGGRWWPTARDNGEVHAGWQEIPAAALRTGPAAAKARRERWSTDQGRRQGEVTRDLNALTTLLDQPSQHVWVTFEQGRLWWCTVFDEIKADDTVEPGRGHFWLTCRTPWTDRSLDGRRHLLRGDLPGSVTSVAGYRTTICRPEASDQILRVIRNEQDPKALASQQAREGYRQAIADLLGQLRERDFELLVDLILARDGWARLGALAGSMSDIDTEVENRSSNEIAFVQVKSQADQSILNDYVDRFAEQRDRYARMIFAVHTPKGCLAAPKGLPIQVWDRPRLADLVVRMGLGEWIERRV
jgi:hypothetical protein